MLVYLQVGVSAGTDGPFQEWAGDDVKLLTAPGLFCHRHRLKGLGSMQASLDTIHRTRDHLTRVVKRRGVRYWQCLCQAGIPESDARKIAAAIAKYDAVGRPPSVEQRSLIMRYSPMVCRAQLWRRQLL